MSILELSREALTDYGRFGDESLEYIGIMISSQGILEKRIYRKNSESVLKDVGQRQPYKYILGEILPQFYNYGGIELCDISCSHVNAIQTYRIVFKLPKKQTFGDLYRTLEVFFSCIPNSGSYKERLYGQLSSVSSEFICQSSLLLQIGVEFDGYCKLKSLKYYMNIDNGGEHYKDNLLCEYKFDKEYQIICENGYKPIFIGINDTDGIEEHKLYFISKSLGFKTAGIFECTSNLAVALGWDQVVSLNEFRQLYDMDLFLEGIAFSPHRGGVWRLYFREFAKRHYLEKY